MPLIGRLDNVDNSIPDGSIQSKELQFDFVDLGGVKISLGQTIAQPQFNLINATGIVSTSIQDGNITESKLDTDSVSTIKIIDGAVTNVKLENDSVSYGGVTLSLGQSDGTPAFDLTNATNYQAINLVGLATDADKLDGQEGSYYRNASNINAGTLSAARLPSTMNATTFTGDLRVDNDADLRIGDGAANERILIQKADNNVSDHIIFYNGTKRIGEIGCEDTSWLRINQETATNIYTPRYIRADGGFFVDGTKGINGSGNFVGGTIAGASDYGSLLRSNATDTSSQRISFQANATNNWDTIATASGSQGSIEVYNTGSGNDAFMAFHTGGDFAIYFGLDADTNDLSVGGWSMGANKYRVWHAGNDGAGSELDADKLDGHQENIFMRRSANSDLIMNGQSLHFGASNTNSKIRWSGTTTLWDLITGNLKIRDNLTDRFTFARTTGDFTATGNVTAYSDIYLKKDIEVIKNPIEKIKQIRGVTYSRIDLEGEDNERQAGVIAQEVEKVLSEVVKENKDGIKSVAYGNMVGLLVEAIKEQQKQIDDLKAKLENKQ